MVDRRQHAPIHILNCNTDRGRVAKDSGNRDTSLNFAWIEQDDWVIEHRQTASLDRSQGDGSVVPKAPEHALHDFVYVLNCVLL
jgi:hypothetical protein